MNDSNLYLSMVLLGQVVPPVLDLVNKHVVSAKLRFISSLLVSSIIAILVNFEQLRFGSMEEALISALILFASGQSAYKLYYEGSTWQSNIRFNHKAFPVKELIPPVELLMPKFRSGKSSNVPPTQENPQ